eukprot:CAMPEP_0202720776 /NCGR_PEP_ID=MMETSP1385-20130828/143120_1 /ASSEMBLY_ACC=CAM_ASM_000861 /TAXON_ID=933848 /ORGANISM="Elphidium margaritaceum" /LENGTH=630 /DNA_ID=CAMNT_0049384683 /DNA_START=35 /DNA_END=1927 /DNA_ORIENTATION=-
MAVVFAVMFVVAVSAGPHHGDNISCGTFSSECHIQCNDSNPCNDATIISTAVSTTISCDSRSDDVCSFSVMQCGNISTDASSSIDIIDDHHGSCLIDIESSTSSSEIHCNGLNTCVVASDHEWVSSTLHCYDNNECILLCPTHTSCIDSVLMCHSDAHCECSGVGCTAVSHFILASDYSDTSDENSLDASSSTDSDSYFGVRFQYIVLLNVLAMIGFLLCCCGYLSIKVSRYFVLFYSDKLETEEKALQNTHQHSTQAQSQQVPPPSSKSYSKSVNADVLSNSSKTPSNENTVLLTFAENDTDHEMNESPPQTHVHKKETLIKTSEDEADEGGEHLSCTHTKFALPIQMKIDVNAKSIARDTTKKLDRLPVPNPEPLALALFKNSNTKSTASTEPEIIDVNVCHSDDDSTMEPLSMTQHSLTLAQDNSRDTLIIRRSPQLAGHGHFNFERDRACTDARSEQRSYAVKMTLNTRSQNTDTSAQVAVLPLVRAHLSNSDLSQTHEHIHALALAANDSTCQIMPIPEGTQCMIDYNPLQKRLFLTPGTNTAPITPRSPTNSAQTYTMLFGSCASNEVSRNHQDAEHDQASFQVPQAQVNTLDDEIGDHDTLSLGMNTPTTNRDFVVLETYDAQ